ncbi:hypothetical protein XaFJ1_GM001835 [Xanthomonas albilineans]|nr:hypothetical protein XaFJ1_GM001835 [Xanthomonas albilineans]
MPTGLRKAEKIVDRILGNGSRQIRNGIKLLLLDKAFDRLIGNHIDL